MALSFSSMNSASSLIQATCQGKRKFLASSLLLRGKGDLNFFVIVVQRSNTDGTRKDMPWSGFDAAQDAEEEEMAIQ